MEGGREKEREGGRYESGEREKEREREKQTDRGGERVVVRD